MSPWIRASRPLAQANIAFPLVAGQALAYALTGAFDWTLAALVHLWGVVDQLFILWSNDVADREADAANPGRTLFSGGSGVLQDGGLTPRALARGAWIALGALLAVSAALALLGRPLALVAFALAAALAWAYSFPPLRLSYRGGGEVLQGLGVGVVLPALGFYAQAGTSTPLPLELLGATFLLGFAGNLMTALPDAPADREAGKRTWAVRFGEGPARLACVALLAVGVAGVVGASPALDGLERRVVAGLPAAALVLALPGLRTARAADRRACVRFVFLCGLALNLLYASWAWALAT